VRAIIVVLLLTASADAQERPKIGLALGGGSARGFAHIGVLEWFEQHHIPIDYIAGTSMGGLVGGAYASGLSPAEIRALMRDVDWDLMFLADSPYKYKTFERKVDKRLYPSRLEFGLKGGFRLPGGIDSGQQVTLLLDRVGLPYGDLRSFDDLPTPFRCVATDLRRGEVVVLDAGPLSRALRATMSLPGVFTPVKVGDRVLVDGGALNNVPADVVRRMGADVVIAVDVGADVADAPAPSSLFAMLGQTIDTMMVASTRRALESATLVIYPALAGFTSTSWSESAALAQRGYDAAERLSIPLGAYAVSPSEYQTFATARASRRISAAPTAAFVHVTGVPGDQRDAIRRRLQQHVGTAPDPESIREALEHVAGSDRYEQLTYRWVRADQESGIQVDVTPKAYGPPFLAVSLEMSNVDSSAFAASLAARVLAYDILVHGSQLRVDGRVGTRRGAGVDLQMPVGPDPFFVAARAGYLEAPRYAFVDDRVIGEYRIGRAVGGLDVGATFRERLHVRIGMEVAHVSGTPSVGSPFLPSAAGTEASMIASAVFDSQTSPLVPTRGLYLRGRLRRVFASPDFDVAENLPSVTEPEQFWQAEVDGTQFWPMHEGDRAFVRFGVGTSFDADPVIENFSLGGPFRLGAFRQDEVRGAHYLLGAVGYLKRTGAMPFGGGDVLVGAWVEQGSAWSEWNDAAYHVSVSGGAVLESLLGPVFIGASSDFTGRFRYYVSLGPLFR